MLDNLNNNVIKDDKKFLILVIGLFLFVAWLCTPPGNKVFQILYWGNNTKFFISKITNNAKDKEYLYHRKNAIYLAKMYPNNSNKSLSEMNKAILTVPNFVSNDEVNNMYRDMARIKLYTGDKKGALNDFLRAGDIQFLDKMPVALMLADRGNYNIALRYCKDIFEAESGAFSGYACMAQVYSLAGRNEVALKLYDMAIDNKKNNYWAYLERSKIKEKMNDKAGAEQDFQMARRFAPRIQRTESYFDEFLSPKILMVSTQ